MFGFSCFNVENCVNVAGNWMCLHVCNIFLKPLWHDLEWN